ncbi:MAG: thioredoxin domain-containing protein [Halopseudomonas sp.]
MTISRKGALILNLLAGLVLFGVVYTLTKPEIQQTTTDPFLFQLGGQSYRSAELPNSLKQSLYEADLQAFTVRQQILQTAVVELYIDQQAQKNGESTKQVQQRLLPQQPIPEAALQEFYQRNKARIRVSFERARGDIERLLQQQQRQQQQQQLITKLTQLNELQLFINPPTSDAVSIDIRGYPSKGKPDAEVVLVEFADYQCPHCKRAHETLKSVLTPYLDRVRYSYLDLPINRSGISRQVAEGAVCADQQQRFWDYQDSAFEQQAQLNQDSVRELAQQLNLDITAFNQCLQDSATAVKVKAAEQQAIAAGVTGTPTFFINGHKVRLKQSLEHELPQLLEQALNR